VPLGRCYSEKIMLSFHKLVFGIGALAGCIGALNDAGAASVWKVTDASGAVIYLGGSMHALRPIDYPLPPAFTRAFDASSRLVFEVDPKNSAADMKDLLKAGQYPKGDNLKNHVDPRTYDYLRRFFAARNVPEAKFVNFRPWLIDILLSAPPAEYFNLGVERFLAQRARSSSKPMAGLESVREHNQVFAGLTDRESEIVLLIFFINAGQHDRDGESMIASWRRGDVDPIATHMRKSYRDFPAFYQRLITARNQKWVPKIEQYLRSGQTYFVVAGAGHMGGSDGLLALLRQRGCRIEQL